MSLDAPDRVASRIGRTGRPDPAVGPAPAPAVAPQSSPADRAANDDRATADEGERDGPDAGRHGADSGRDVDRGRGGDGGRTGDAEGHATLLAALEGSPTILFGMDDTLRYRWVANIQPPWSEEMLIGRTDAEILGEVEGAALTRAKGRVLDTGRPETLEIDLQHDHQRHWYEVRLKRHLGEDGTRSLVCSALDISEKKRREIMLRALLREVSHRSKNLLAMVLSIASQTSRHSFDKHTFLSRFTGRIQSIARSQDTITHSDWRGAALSELIESQVFSALPGRSRSVTLEGTDLQLTPTAALHVGLALHELTTNALAHGALLSREGAVTIAARLGDEGTSGDAVIEWRETASDAYKSDRDESFGMTTLKRIVPAAVGGDARLTLTPDGLAYRLTLSPEHQDGGAIPLGRLKG